MHPLIIILSVFIIPAIVVAIILIATSKRHKDSSRKNLYHSRTYFKGAFGEYRVESVLGKTIEGTQYVINNYTIVNDGKSSQIDHIFVNKFGIFVIETKNFSGQIYGSDEQLEWTQVLNYGKIKNKIYNPVKQNASHVYKIRSILPNYPIRSLVVFVKDNVENINSSTVIPLSKLRQTVNSGVPLLDSRQMRHIYDTLLAHRSSITQEEHINNIHLQQERIANNICPRCGGKLVLRHGQYGDFFGCSNFPKCTFKKKIK